MESYNSYSILPGLFSQYCAYEIHPGCCVLFIIMVSRLFHVRLESGFSTFIFFSSRNFLWYKTSCGIPSYETPNRRETVLVGAGVEGLDHHLLLPFDPLSTVSNTHYDCDWFLFLLYNFLYFPKKVLYAYICMCVRVYILVTFIPWIYHPFKCYACCTSLSKWYISHFSQ